MVVEYIRYVVAAAAGPGGEKLQRAYANAAQNQLARWRPGISGLMS